MTAQRYRRLAGPGLLAASVLAGAALAQSAGGPYGITSEMAGSGGGHSDGSALALDSSIGEPVVGDAQAGGAYDLSGGFQQGNAATNAVFGNGFE